MIELTNNRLRFRFPDIHEAAWVSICFQRTFRIPDDGREYPLPPGFGASPLVDVDDFAATVPAVWAERGGVFLPMYQAEAMWISFEGDYPCAIRVAAGRVDALTGEVWTPGALSASPQNYLVVPDQPWLDGFCVAKGRIRQFVAMPLGAGYTAEEQLTGEAAWGGLQFLVFPMKREKYLELSAASPSWGAPAMLCEAPAMGLAPGGLMVQEIYEDSYGLDAWDTEAASACFVHIANSATWRAITGCNPPSPPPTASDYAEAGLPWFDWYEPELKALEGSARLAGLESVAAMADGKGDGPLSDNESVEAGPVLVLGRRRVIREGGLGGPHSPGSRA